MGELARDVECEGSTYMDTVVSRPLHRAAPLNSDVLRKMRLQVVTNQGGCGKGPSSGKQQLHQEGQGRNEVPYRIMDNSKLEWHLI